MDNYIKIKLLHNYCLFQLCGGRWCIHSEITEHKPFRAELLHHFELIEGERGRRERERVREEEGEGGQ